MTNVCDICGAGRTHVVFAEARFCSQHLVEWMNSGGVMVHTVEEFIAKERAKLAPPATQWTIEDANRELRRLTPGWSEDANPFGSIVRCSPSQALVVSSWMYDSATPGAIRPRTQAELLARIEKVQPWSQDVALQICRAMLVGWQEILQLRCEGDFFPPDMPRGDDGLDYVDWVSSLEDARTTKRHTRETLITACETALARYMERQKNSSANSQGHGTTPGLGEPCLPERSQGPSGVVSGAGRQGNVEQDGFSHEDKPFAAAPARPAGVIQAKGGDATDGPADSVSVARGGTVHPEAAPKLTPCAECRAPLRADQIKLRQSKTDVYCAYCVQRDKLSVADLWLKNDCPPERAYMDLDGRIEAARYRPEQPRPAHDWDVDDAEYEP